MEVELMVAMAVFAVIGSYVVTSVLLFNFPNVLHRKKTPKFRCRHISHRGGAGENLENTIPAFDHAVRLGTDMIEIDLQLTKDGIVVVSHDGNLLRTTGLNADVSELNYDELPPLKNEIPIDFDPGKVCRASNKDRRIPRLSELFERYPRLPINIDVKSNNPLLIDKVSELIRRHERENFTVWGNANDAVARKCYKQNPDVATFFSFGRVVKLVLLTYSGLLPFFPLREGFFEIFLPSIFLRKDFQDAKSKRSIRFAIWVAEKLLIRKFLFNHLSKRGIQTYIWVLNTEEDYAKAFSEGATGVMTDYPTKLRNFLDANPQFK